MEVDLTKKFEQMALLNDHTTELLYPHDKCKSCSGLPKLFAKSFFVASVTQFDSIAMFMYSGCQYNMHIIYTWSKQSGPASLPPGKRSHVNFREAQQLQKCIKIKCTDQENVEGRK